MVFFWQRQSRSAQRSRGMNLSTTSSTLTQNPAITVSPPSSSTLHMSSNTTTSRSPHLWSRGGPSPRSRKSRSGDVHSELDDDLGPHAVGGSDGRTSDTSGSSSSHKTHHPSRPFSGVFVLDKLVEFSRRKQETDRRRVAEKELDSLNMKINKLLSKMGEADGETQGKIKLEEECVVCLAAPASMQTFPCGHKVVCRKCLIKTIQVAVSQRCLPLRCVICRDRILKLQHAHQQADATGDDYTSRVASSVSHPPQISLSGSSGGSGGAVFGGSPPHQFPTSPSKVFSLLTSTGSRPLCPKQLSANCSTPFPTSPRHLERSHQSSEEVRYNPANLEAFVHSHNDALNLQTTTSDTFRKVHAPNDTKSNNHKHHLPASQQSSSHSKRQETPCLSFMSTQAVKIHPKASSQICAFMDSPDAEYVSPEVQTSTKTAKTNRFIAKFLPRSGQRRKHARKRQE